MNSNLQVGITTSAITCTTATLTANVVSTIGPCTYQWLGSNSTTQSIQVNMANPQSTVVVTDAVGCVVTAQIDSIPPPYTISINVGYVSGCINSTATAIATGGSGAYTYSWSTANSTTNVASIPTGSLNNYLTVTDANGCHNTKNLYPAFPYVINSNEVMAIQFAGKTTEVYNYFQMAVLHPIFVHGQTEVMGFT